MSFLPRWTGRNTIRRRLVQVACLAVFLLLPLFDLFRFDFTAGRLHLFGAEIWLDEWALLWLALMFGMWLIGAMSLLFGRVYCAYACPQMVFTEIAHDFDAIAKRLVRPLDPKHRPRAAQAISLVLIAVLSVTASVFFLAYFAPLSTVVSKLAHFEIGPWVGAIGALTALLAFLDFVFLRETFCRSACPYGLLQGVIEDGRSLHVKFDESTGKCIECLACVKACPMEIDIRDGAFQIECTRCGSCIDACDTILDRLKRPGLLTFDLAGFSLRGFDLKRVLVTAATLGFALVFTYAVLTRDMVAVHLSPIYSDTVSEMAESRFLLRAANRGREPVVLGIRSEGLPASARIEGLEDTRIPAGQEKRLELVVRFPLSEAKSSVTPFVWVVKTPEGEKRFASSVFARGRAS
jgi:polyferredoxin